jgi:hypothetical protein
VLDSSIVGCWCFPDEGSPVADAAFDQLGTDQASVPVLKPLVKAAYDQARAKVDILAMPTTPFPVTKLRPRTAPWRSTSTSR